MFCTRARLDLPYTADDGGGPIRVVDAGLDIGVTVTAIEAGMNTISFFDEDGTRLGGEELAAMDVERVELVPRFGDTISTGAPLAFATEVAGEITVVPRNGDTSLRDDALGLRLPAHAKQTGLDRFTIDDVDEGSYEIVVTVGTMTWTLPLVVTNRADAVSPQDPPSAIEPMTLTKVCFGATTQGRVISGLRWSHVVDGVEAYSLGNCVLVGTEDDLPPFGSVSISATAGGVASPTLTLPVALP